MHLEISQGIIELFTIIAYFNYIYGIYSYLIDTTACLLILNNKAIILYQQYIIMIVLYLLISRNRVTSLPIEKLWSLLLFPAFVFCFKNVF